MFNNRGFFRSFSWLLIEKFLRCTLNSGLLLFWNDEVKFQWLNYDKSIEFILEVSRLLVAVSVNFDSVYSSCSTVVKLFHFVAMLLTGCFIFCLYLFFLFYLFCITSFYVINFFNHCYLSISCRFTHDSNFLFQNFLHSCHVVLTFFMIIFVFLFISHPHFTNHSSYLSVSIIPPPCSQSFPLHPCFVCPILLSHLQFYLLCQSSLACIIGLLIHSLH